MKAAYWATGILVVAVAIARGQALDNSYQNCWAFLDSLGPHSDFQRLWTTTYDAHPKEVWKAFKKVKLAMAGTHQNGESKEQHLGYVMMGPKFSIETANPDAEGDETIGISAEDDTSALYRTCPAFRKNFHNMFNSRVFTKQHNVFRSFGFVAIHSKESHRLEDPGLLEKACRVVKHNSIETLYKELPMAVLAKTMKKRDSIEAWTDALEDCPQVQITQTVIGMAYDAIRTCALDEVFDHVSNYCEGLHDRRSHDRHNVKSFVPDPEPRSNSEPSTNQCSKAKMRTRYKVVAGATTIILSITTILLLNLLFISFKKHKSQKPTEDDPVGRVVHSGKKEGKSAPKSSHDNDYPHHGHASRAPRDGRSPHEGHAHRGRTIGGHAAHAAHGQSPHHSRSDSPSLLHSSHSAHSLHNGLNPNRVHRSHSPRHTHSPTGKPPSARAHSAHSADRTKSPHHAHKAHSHSPPPREYGHSHDYGRSHAAHSAPVQSGHSSPRRQTPHSEHSPTTGHAGHAAHRHSAHASQAAHAARAAHREHLRREHLRAAHLRGEHTRSPPSTHRGHTHKGHSAHSTHQQHVLASPRRHSSASHSVTPTKSPRRH